MKIEVVGFVAIHGGSFEDAWKRGDVAKLYRITLLGKPAPRRRRIRWPRIVEWRLGKDVGTPLDGRRER